MLIFCTLPSDDIITKSGNNNIVVKHLDLSDLESVRKFAAEINEEEPQLHVLVNLFAELFDCYFGI